MTKTAISFGRALQAFSEGWRAAAERYGQPVDAPEASLLRGGAWDQSEARRIALAPDDVTNTTDAQIQALADNPVALQREIERLRAVLDNICDLAATKPLLRSDLVKLCDDALAGSAHEPGNND